MSHDFHRAIVHPAGMQLVRRGMCLVIAGPSGCGKTTVMERLLRADWNLRQSISVTTRQPRAGEVDGVHYHFCDQARFDQLVASGGMLEHAGVHGRSYGIPRAPVEDALRDGVDLVFVVDWQGYQTLCSQLPGDVLGVFLLPPSTAELGNRMLARGDDPVQVAARMQGVQVDMDHKDDFVHQVLNADIDAATRGVADILAAQRRARSCTVLDRMARMDESLVQLQAA